MSFLSPGYFWLAGLAIPILVLYLLRVRREPVRVSSILLWETVLQDRWVDTPWQRLKRNRLLILQLLALAALVLGLARPALAVPNPTSGAVILLLDASASMQATDVAPNRFGAARTEAIALIESLDRSAQAGVILVGPEPGFIVPLSTDRTTARDLLAAASATQGEGDWITAFSLAAGTAKSINGPVTTVIFSDGGLPPDGLPPLPGQIRFIPIGVNGQNVGISGLALRQGSLGSELFASATNFGDSPLETVLVVELNGAPVRAKNLPMGPGETIQTIETDLPAAGLFTVRLALPAGGSAPMDVFDLDDQASLWHQPRPSNRILLGTGGNYFLESLIEALPGYAVSQALPGDSNRLSAPIDGFDILILDGLALPEELSANVLWLNPPDNRLFPVGPAFTPQPGDTFVHRDPRTAFLSWNNINILVAKAVELPAWATTLVDSGGQPLVFAGETAGSKLAVITFDIRDSDLPLQVDFPILFSHLVAYLGQPATAFPTGYTTVGNPVALPAPANGESLKVVSPSGETIVIRDAGDSEPRFVPSEIGVHELILEGAEGKGQTAPLPVNLLSQSESEIAPDSELMIGGSSIAAASGEEIGYRELTGWLIGIGIVLLLVEWFLFHQADVTARWGSLRNQRIGYRRPTP